MLSEVSNLFERVSLSTKKHRFLKQSIKSVCIWFNEGFNSGITSF
jgi:hypothetical protein